MKPFDKKQRYILFYILFSISCFQGIASAGLDDGLVAFFPFNGNANDETGNGCDGTVHNAILTADRFGNSQSAYSFDGYTSYIDIGNTLNFPCGDYAVSVWFLNTGAGPHVNGYGQKIMAKATFFNDFYMSVFTYGHSAPYAGMLLWQQYQGTGPGPKAIMDMDYDYLDNTWHHLVVNKDGNYGEMWVDGLLVGTANTFTDVCNSQNLYVGYTDHPDSWQRNEGHWNGKIDDIRIYDRMLSESEIDLLFLGYLQVDIDIKPGDDPNCINIDDHGVIPVAILGSSNFDVSEVNLSNDSLSFNGLRVRVRGNNGPMCSEEDVNGDVIPDLVCQFEDDSENWLGGDDTATLNGELFDGTPIKGTDAICIVP